MGHAVQELDFFWVFFGFFLGFKNSECELLFENSVASMLMNVK